MRVSFNVLGSSAAIPAFGRHLSAQLLKTDQEYYLIDCGEATQFQLKKYGHKLNKISHIFISHLHGDHYFGLVGLLMSMDLQERKNRLEIHGPDGIKKIITVQIPFGLNFEISIFEHDCSSYKHIAVASNFNIYSFPLKHRIPCQGFLFEECEKPLKLKKEAIEKYNLSIDEIKKIKQGNDFILNNERISNIELTMPQLPLKKIAYCSDTIYDEEIIEYVKNADLLFHEATYLDDMQDVCKKYFHSSAADAAKIAKMSDVKKLIIGHFSSRYPNLDKHLEESVKIFPETYLAIEGYDFLI